MFRSSSSTSACMPSAMVAAFMPGDAGPEDDDLRGVDAGHATHERAAATVGPHEGMGPDLRGQSAGHLRHRGQQRKRAIR